jgi:hypothetical protein
MNKENNSYISQECSGIEKIVHYISQELRDTNKFCEDGERIIVTVYFIIAQYKSGKRLRHCATLECADPLRHILIKIADNKIPDYENHWYEVYPQYGSPYHAKVGDEHLYDDDDKNIRLL